MKSTITHNEIKYKFFWNGMFSNWYPSNFEVYDIEFNCGEQYMMYTKAMLFNDHETAEEILNESSPKIQKQLGRKVKNFDAKLWDEKKYELVKKGLKEKFEQNKDLKDNLIYHKGCQIVEASPYDRIWGIGYLDKDAIENIDNWGENLLGKILTELANEI